MKKAIVVLAVFGFVISATNTYAGWAYELAIKYIYPTSAGDLYVAVDKDLSPSCTEKWVHFQPGDSNYMNKVFSVFLTAYVAGKKVGIATNGCLPSGYADGAAVQLTECNGITLTCP